MFVTFEKAVEDTRALIEEKGRDYVYTTDPKTVETRNIKGRGYNDSMCYYVHYDGTPGCIIGHLLLLWRDNPVFIEKNNYDKQLEKNHIEVNNKTRLFLQNLQFEQDDDKTWGEAFDTALAECDGK